MGLSGSLGGFRDCGDFGVLVIRFRFYCFEFRFSFYRDEKFWVVGGLYFVCLFSLSVLWILIYLNFKIVFKEGNMIIFFCRSGY